MQAIRVHQFGGPEVLKLETLPDPTPSSTQVVLRVRAIGVNPVETYVRSGKYPVLPSLPYIPGSDCAGEIEAIGPDVKCWSIGDRVYTARIAPGFGAYATMTVADAGQVYRLPDHITFQQGAAIGVAYATAYRALFHRAQVRPGEIVLIHGATGAVGLAAVQLAVARGCIVYGTGGTERGRALVAEQGAAHVFDHRASGYLDEITRASGGASGGAGVNAIVEMLTNVNLDRDLGLLAKFGRVVVVGNRGRVEIDARQTMAKETSILGMSLWSGGDAAVAEAHAAIVAGLNARTLRPIIDREYSLTEAAKAHDNVMSEGSAGKIVLMP